MFYKCQILLKDIVKSKEHVEYHATELWLSYFKLNHFNELIILKKASLKYYGEDYVLVFWFLKSFKWI